MREKKKKKDKWMGRDISYGPFTNIEKHCSAIAVA